MLLYDLMNKIVINKIRYNGRPRNDAFLIIQKIKENAIEFQKAAYMHFVYLQKVFDKFRVSDVLNVLQQKWVPINNTKIIKEICTDTEMKVKVNGE